MILLSCVPRSERPRCSGTTEGLSLLELVEFKAKILNGNSNIFVLFVDLWYTLLARLAQLTFVKRGRAARFILKTRGWMEAWQKQSVLKCGCHHSA